MQMTYPCREPHIAFAPIISRMISFYCGFYCRKNNFYGETTREAMIRGEAQQATSSDNASPPMTAPRVLMIRHQPILFQQLSLESYDTLGPFLPTYLTYRTGLRLS